MADLKSDFDQKQTEEVMPRWNFENFYPSPKSTEFSDDFQKLTGMIEKFADKYEKKTGGLDGNGLAIAIKEKKDIDSLTGKLCTYLDLKASQDTKYSDTEAGFNNKLRPLNSRLQFFSHEIKQLGEQGVKDLIKSSSALQKYEPMLEKIIRGIPHTPPLDVSKYSSELSAESGWIKLYDDRMVALRFPFEGKDLTEGDIIEIFSYDPDQERRKAAHEVFVEVLEENSWFFTHVHNEIMRLSQVDDRWTSFDNPWDSRHFSNNIAPEVVDALENAVKNAYSRTSQRFYALKAALMGQEHLNIYDRNVNIFSSKNERKIPFSEGKKIVLDAYRKFLPEMAEAAEKFFDNGWIDAPPDESKRGGAFAHPGASKLANPMVMLNYRNNPGDVGTMAHELGHGVHQYLAAHKGDAIVSTPLTMAETASVFGEMLTFRSLVDSAGEDEKRKLLFDKVNDMINTVVRQISFYDFEKRIRKAYIEKGKPLTPEEMGGHWKEALQDSYGDSIPLDEDYGCVFGYIPHFVHTPFYVYAYAFGDSLVNALYGVYEEGQIPEDEFKKNYIKMLEAGGTLKLSDLKDMFGLDVEDPGFWEKGLGLIEGMIDELEQLCQPLLVQKAVPQQGSTPEPGIS
jgi:oligoendopeptidase F